MTESQTAPALMPPASMDMDIVDSVRALFPAVTSAVQQYRLAKDDREARNLARRLANEEVFYYQFIIRLALLSSAVSMESRENDVMHNFESRFGREATDRLRSHLRHMYELLRGLKTDLENTSRGTEVLTKLKRKPKLSRESFPETPLHKCLYDISKANRSLEAHLGNSHAILPAAGDFQTSLDFRLFRHLSVGQRTNCFKITGDSLVCACKKPVSGAITHSGHTPSNVAAGLHQRFGPISVSTSNSEKIGENIAFLTRDDFPAANSHEGSDKNEQTIRLTVSESNLPPAAIGLGRLISRDGPSLDPRRRMELAFRLSSAVLFLWKFPNEFSSSRWKDWAVSFDPEHVDSLPSFYLSPSSPFDHESLDGTTVPETTFSILSREPALTLLGLRLIELAFGQSLAGLSQRDPRLLPEEETRDKDSRDLVIAKRLLASHRIRERFGRAYESVVAVCLNHQYRARKGASIKELSLQDQSFLKPAAVTILLPLYEEVRKYHGCTCNATRAEGPGQVSNEERKLHASKNKRRQEDARNTPPAPAISKLRILDEVVHGDVTQVPFDLPHASEPLSGLSEHGGSEDLVSYNPSVHGPKPVAVVSGDDPHGYRTGDGDTHQFHDGSMNPEYPLSSDSSALVVNKSADEPEESQYAVGSSGVNLGSKAEPEASRKGHLGGSQRGLHRAPRNVDQEAEEERDGDPDDGHAHTASVCSYDTMTATTDSVFAGLSESTEERTSIPANHPLFLFQNVAVRVLMRAFRSWRTRVGESDDPSGPIMREETSKKRTRTTLKNNEDEDEQGESARRSSALSAKKRRVGDEGPLFSCPFLKKDPVKYGGECCMHFLRRISDVKQHLKRRHQIPIYCPFCMRNFDKEADCHIHIRQRNCEILPGGMVPDGITESQKRQLAKKAPPNESLEDQWYGIFDLLFPRHEPRPLSPYIETGFMQKVEVYQSFISSHGPRIIDNVLTAGDHVQWRYPPGVSDMETFRHSVIGAVFPIIFNEWIGSGGLANSLSNPMSASTWRSPLAINRQRGERQGSQRAAHGGDEDSEQQTMTTPSNLASNSSSHDSTDASRDEGSEWLPGSDLHSDIDGALLPFDQEELHGIFSTMNFRIEDNDSPRYE